MMTIEDLQQDLAQVQASLAHWQKKLDEALDVTRRAQLQAGQAQEQIAVHRGALAQIEVWLKRLA